MNENFNYPSTTATNANVLYSNLGSFWTQMFQEKKTIKGLTIAHAEQLIQSYYELLDTVTAYSIDNISIFEKHKWQPLVIKRSELNNAPLLFGEAVFGVQPETDEYYEGITFHWGAPKDEASAYFSWKPTDTIKDIKLIANRVLSPSNVQIGGIDFSYVNNTVYFRVDPFITHQGTPIITDNGENVTFMDRDNRIINDELLILWAYHADVDHSGLYYNYGYLFQFNQPSSESYQQILQTVIKLFTGGPSPKALLSVCAAFLDIKVVVEAEETIETISDNTVITNRNVYIFDDFYTLRSDIHVGDVVEAGDVLVEDAAYYDYVSYKNWWTNKMQPKINYSDVIDQVHTMKYSLPPYLFLGGVEGELIFSNDIQMFPRDVDGYLRFPVEGSEADVQRFNDVLNENADEIGYAVGLEPGEVIMINPVDFIFENFLKTASALVKLNFKSLQQTKLFTEFFPNIRKALPRHVYFIIMIDTQLTVDLYDQLNDAIVIEYDGDEYDANADGSTEDLLMLPGETTTYPTDVKARLFSIGNGTTPELLEVTINSGTADLLVTDGAVLTNIPEGQTNRTVSNLLLLDFS